MRLTLYYAKEDTNATEGYLRLTGSDAGVPLTDQDIQNWGLSDTLKYYIVIPNGLKARIKKIHVDATNACTIFIRWKADVTKSDTELPPFTVGSGYLASPGTMDKEIEIELPRSAGATGFALYFTQPNGGAIYATVEVELIP